MKVKVNGEARILQPGSNLLEFLKGLQLPRLDGGIAVCLNGEVIRRDQWSRQELQSEDELEIVQATQGG